MKQQKHENGHISSIFVHFFSSTVFSFWSVRNVLGLENWLLLTLRCYCHLRIPQCNSYFNHSIWNEDKSVCKTNEGKHNIQNKLHVIARREFPFQASLNAQSASQFGVPRERERENVFFFYFTSRHGHTTARFRFWFADFVVVECYCHTVYEIHIKFLFIIQKHEKKTDLATNLSLHLDLLRTICFVFFYI